MVLSEAGSYELLVVHHENTTDTHTPAHPPARPPTVCTKHIFNLFRHVHLRLIPRA